MSKTLSAAAGARIVTPGATRSVAPWWRVGMVWLVIGGPLVVVVASLVTAVVAWRGADEVLVEQASTRVAPVTRPTADTPAMAARNHAATAAAR